MEKIRVSKLKKKGILKKFLYKNNEVKLNDKIALIKSENCNFIVKSPMDGVVINKIKEESKIKNNTVIAHLLTTENEIKKYYFKVSKKNKFSFLSKKEKNFFLIKNNNFGKKWKNIEEDNYSGIGLLDKNNSYKTTSKSLIKKPEFYNNKTIINSEKLLVEEKQQFDNEILKKNFDKTKENFLLNEKNVNNVPIFLKNIKKKENINFEQQKNNVFLKEQIFEQSTKKKYKINKLLNKKKLFFSNKKIKKLSFKNKKNNNDYIVNENKKKYLINEIKKITNNEEKNIKKNNINNVNDLNLKNFFKKNNFDLENNDLNKFSLLKKPTVFVKKNITNDFSISKEKFLEKNKLNEKNKNFDIEIKEKNNIQDNKTIFLKNENENNSFRFIVNKRLEKLHNNNNFNYLLFENNNLKNSTNFLNKSGRPNILRNIVLERMNNLIKKNISSKIKKENLNYFFDYKDKINNFSNDKNKLFNKTNNFNDYYKNNLNKLKEKKTEFFLPLKPYHYYLNKKLNDKEQREKILKTKNQRELINNRIKQISKVKIEKYDSTLKEINENNFFETFKETKLKFNELNNKYYNNNNNNNLNNKEINFKKNKLFKKINKNKNIYKNNNFNSFFLKKNIINNNISSKLINLENYLTNQKQNNIKNKLLWEIKKIYNYNDNYINNTNIDKAVQYILIQQVFKIINKQDYFFKKIFKKLKYNIKKNK